MSRLRHELKYEIDLHRAAEFFKELEPYCDLDPHAGATGSYEIASVYYDTEDLRFYYDREESVGYRRKIRLRTYNQDGNAVALFLEIKEKHKQYVGKKRINMSSLDVLKLGIPHNQLPLSLVARYLKDSAEAREILYLHKRLMVYPVVLIRYIRKPFVSKFDNDLRITLDTRITAGGDDLEKYDANHEKHIVNPNHGILEVKTNKSIPLWLHSIIEGYGLVQCRYSKYCLGVDAIYSKNSPFLPSKSVESAFLKEQELLAFGNVA
jgi:SPX domain protein involved in polyphosphate accumulation